MFEKYRVERWKEVYAPNAAMLRFLMEREGYRVYQWGDTPGAIFVLHKHSEAQSHWIVSGSLELTVNGVSYTLEAGDRDFLPAETWHSARVVSEETVVYMVGEKIR
jgi:quercetin dioxygenase-like cupin family protein